MQLGRALSRPQETPSLWRAWLVSAWPSPKWIERPEGDEGPSLWRDILVFFALLPVVIWLRINFLHPPAWAPANGLASTATAPSYLTKRSMLSLELAKQGRWEEYYADQTSRFWQAQWSRVTLKIIRRWETEIDCMASNTWHKIKWTRILAERRLLKAGG